jgi:cAMP-binding proteins - catabolite gene activator and regulatory subunit of cAMP-dependent protein kinases
MNPGKSSGKFVPNNPSPLAIPSKELDLLAPVTTPKETHQKSSTTSKQDKSIALASETNSLKSTSLLSKAQSSSVRHPQDIDYYKTQDNDTADPYDYKVPPEFLNRLATFPLFNKAPKSFHTKVASKLTLMQYHPQEYIIKKGDPSKSMYWILKGTVSVTSTDGESIYAELAGGSFFGEIGILFNRPRTATVVARTRVLAGVLTSDALNSVLKSYPLIERRIRDEAQERLAMQDKKNKNEIPNLIYPINSDFAPIQNSINASALASQYAPMPGPSLPPVQSTPSPLSFRSISPSLGTNPSDNVDASISIQDFIKNLHMFQNLPSSIIHQVALGVEPLNVNAFEYIFHQGDVNSDIYFIINGEVEVLNYIKDDSGNRTEIKLARLSSGSYFGEMSFLSYLNESKNFTRSASIRSISSVELMVVQGDKLKSLCNKYPYIVDDMRKTAQERIDLNKSMHTKEDKGRVSINCLINEDSRNDAIHINRRLTPSPRGGLPLDSPAHSKPLKLQHPQSRSLNSQSLFSTNWDFNLANAKAYNEKLSGSVSPVSNLEVSSVFSSDSITKQFNTRNTSFDDNHPARKRKASMSGSTSINNSDITANLSVPALNSPIPSINNFQNFQINYNNTQSPRFALPFLSHNKRLRLSNISGRRRSSVLSNNGPLPDRLLLKVFEYLTLPELMKLRIMSRRWRQLLYVAPNLVTKLDLSPWNTSINDQALVRITDFVGSRPTTINLSNCFHITDEGFSYMVNEIGISGKIKVLKMKSNWEVSAMAIMDLTVPSVGQHLEEIDLSNCRKVRDNVLERLIGWDTTNNKIDDSYYASINKREVDFNIEQIGCKNLKILNVGYCKHLTDNVMYHIANHANQRLESLDLTRCTTFTDKGFQYWSYGSFPNLKKLSLKECTFLSDKAIVSIANASPNIEILDLNFCCALSDLSIEVLCLSCPNIRELDLSFCGSAVSDSSLIAISLHLRNLEKLILKGCIRVTRAGIDALFSGCSPLSYIDVSQCKNAHIYPGGIPAQKLNVNPQTKSAFVSAGPYQNIIEIVL